MLAGLDCLNRQWGTTGKDVGQGPTNFTYPIRCNPLAATASCMNISTDPSDACVISMDTVKCAIDVKQAAYTDAYRVILIGST